MVDLMSLDPNQLNYAVTVPIIAATLMVARVLTH
jgi:hypothetical protein